MADYLASHDREAMRWAIQSADCARDALASAERERSHRARSQRATWTSEDSEHWLGTRVTPLGMMVPLAVDLRNIPLPAAGRYQVVIDPMSHGVAPTVPAFRTEARSN